MGVGLVGQAEMAHIVGAVDGLAQRAQHHRLQQLAVGAVTDALKQRSVVLRVRLVAATQLEAELAILKAAAEALTGAIATEADLLAAFAEADAILRDLSSLPAAATVLASLNAGRGGLSATGWAVAADGARQFNRGSGAAFNPLLPSVT